MKALLLIALVAGQYYEWVDQNGDSHFTDDVSTIPAGMKRRVIQGAEPVLTVTREPRDAGSSLPGAPDAGVAKRPQPPAAPPGPDSCERARAKIAALEATAARIQQRQDDAAASGAARCNRALARSGQAGYALCMAGRESAANPARAKAELEKNAQDLEVAREELRRAQVDGCR